jgi:hypothetical protein
MNKFEKNYCYRVETINLISNVKLLIIIIVIIIIIVNIIYIIINKYKKNYYC